MIEWLLGTSGQTPQVEVAGRSLPLVLRRSAQARRMTMRLAADGSEVRITLPRWGRTADAVAFARMRSDWLASQLEKLPRAEPIGDGSTIMLRGQRCRLRHNPGLPRRISAVDGEIQVGGAAESLAPRLRRWLEGEARRHLQEDLDYYCARAGKPVPRLMLSAAQRRWGSCAKAGTIRINWRLIMAPDGVRRSVVAHEVAHLVHFDHSPAFHALLAQIYESDIAAADRWLKQNGRQLYAILG